MFFHENIKEPPIKPLFKMKTFSLKSMHNTKTLFLINT